MKYRIKIGDLVGMKTHHTGYAGIAVGRYPKHTDTGPIQIGIKWLKGSGVVDWQPEGWLEVISESR